MSFEQIPINLAIEGPTDEIVLRSLLLEIGIKHIQLRARQGKQFLLNNLQNFNIAAQYGSRWLVVIDLDLDASCAPSFIQSILPQPASGMLLRIPVRAIEAWLLADRERFARFLNIAVENIPVTPDLETNPKHTLLDLVARKCRKTRLREDMLPAAKSGRSVGPGYAVQIQEFVTHHWRSEAAAENSDSLRRCINALQNWK